MEKTREIWYQDKYKKDADARKAISEYVKKQVDMIIKKIIKKIKLIISNITLSIKKVKKCQIPNAMHEDIVQILQNTHFAQEEYSLDVKNGIIGRINKFISECDNIATSNSSSLFYNKENTESSRRYLINICMDYITNLDNTLHNVKSCNEYKRLTSGRYSTNDVKTHSIRPIIAEIQHNNSLITLCDNVIDEMSVKLSGHENEEAFSAIKSVMTKTITMIEFRNSILNMYVDASKYFIKDDSSTINTDIYNRTFFPSRRTEFIRRKLSDKDSDYIYQLLTIMNDSSDFSTYIRAFNEFKNRLEIPLNYIVGDIHLQHSGITCRIYEDKINKLSLITGSKILYHTSKINGISELKPTWKASDNVYFTSPRIYFHLNHKGNRLTSGGLLDDDHLYVPTNDIPYVYTDSELRGTACFVETYILIPVNQVQ